MKNESKMKKKSKIRDILETIFYIGFALIALTFIALGLGMMGRRSLFIICPILIIIVCLTISIKKDEKRKKEYRYKNVTESIIEDKTFGEIKVELDTLKNELTCTNLKKLFGKYNPIIRIENYEEKNREFCFRSLEYLYSKQEEIIKTFFEGFLSAYAHVKEITPASLEENFGIEEILITDSSKCAIEDHVVLSGAVDSTCTKEYEEHDFEKFVAVVVSNPDKNKLFGGYYMYPVAYMDCKTKQICYTVED